MSKVRPYAPLLVTTGLFIVTAGLCGGMASLVIGSNFGMYAAITVFVLLAFYLATCLVGWIALRRNAPPERIDRSD
jgi:hypothetical protein